MFSKTRTLFPAYSNLSDVKVALPKPPSRGDVARDASDLWDIHTSEPHITPLDDPGIDAPLPDDGFNPRVDVSENSPQNILANRGSKGELSTDTYKYLLEKTQTLFFENFDAQKHLLQASVGEIKSEIESHAPGAFLLYNGTSKDLLVKALALILSFEALSEHYVSNADFEENAKEELIAFFKISPSVREAMFLPDHMIRQNLLGNTQTFNNLLETFKLYGISESPQSFSMNDEFADYREALVLSDIELNLALNQEICKGLVHQALTNCLNQVLQNVQSSELKYVFKACIESVMSLANKNLSKSVNEYSKLIQNIKSELIKLGVDPQTLRKLSQKEAFASNIQISNLTPSNTGLYTKARHPSELSQISAFLTQSCKHLEKYLKHEKLSADAKLALTCEIYSLLCFKDCCASMMAGENKINDCARNLYDALKEEIRLCELSTIKQLVNNVELAEKSLHSAQVSKTIHLLNKAKSENSLSDKKLETLTKLLG
jgi:hypothetical protein